MSDVLISLVIGVNVSNNPTYIVHGTPVEIHTDVESPKWFTLQAKALDYDNTDRCNPDSPIECSVPIEWYWTEILEIKGQQSVQINDVPNLSTVGMHRVAVFSDSANEPHPKNTSEIVVRRDNTYVGFVSELIGVPFVFWPKKVEGGHQTDLRLAADCSATLVYGKRRMGHNVNYVAPGALVRYLDAIEDGEKIKEGDVLHFGVQTALVSKDNHPIGQLSMNDLIIHSYHELVEEKPFAELPYNSKPYVIYRWVDYLD